MRSLNPCSNGRYSQSINFVIINKRLPSLNPCFNGRYSQSSFGLKEGEAIVGS